VTNKGPHDSERGATIALYASIDAAVQAQQRFESQSLIGEMFSELGQHGLHYVEIQSDVALLLRTGAPIDGVRKIDYGDNLQHWETPLLTAYVDQRFHIADALILLGAGVDAPNAVHYPDGSGFGHTALHMVIARRETAGAEHLIAAGADVNRRTTLGTTPLYFAASNDDAQAVDILLRAGASAEIPDFDGTLPADVAGSNSRFLLSD
jgi:ankyrin repeat protein